MGLREWATRALKEVEQDGTATHTIRLSTDGVVWETWQRPLPELEVFLMEAAAVMESIANECPVRRVALMFTAEAGTGAVIAQFPSSIQGKNKNADGLAGAGNNTVKAFSEGMQGLSAVMVAILASAEKQVNSLTKTLESQSEQIHELLEYHRAKQEAELVEKREESGAQEVVMAQLKELLPQIPVALELFLQDKKLSLAEATKLVASKVVENTTTKPINGVAKQ